MANVGFEQVFGGGFDVAIDGLGTVDDGFGGAAGLGAREGFDGHGFVEALHGLVQATECGGLVYGSWVVHCFLLLGKYQRGMRPLADGAVATSVVAVRRVELP